MVASAALMTGANRSKAKIEGFGWQDEAWALYDAVGELRSAVSWKANALSRINLIAAAPPASQGDEPTPIDPATATPAQRRAVELVEQIAGGIAGQGQMLAAMTRLLEVPGVSYVLAPADPRTDTFKGEWRVLSNDEVRRQGGIEQARNAETGDWEDLNEADLLIKCWRQHPRRAWEPDSPTRGVMSTLKEIELLTKRIAADGRSRLAGAGLLIVPSEAEFPPGQTVAGTDAPEGADDFIQTLIDVASEAIRDQSGPAATVPLVVRVPGEYAQAFTHLKFWSEFSAQLDTLRQSAVRRLALGLDLPADVLLGLGDSNHWSAWQVADEAITMHVEPLAETCCHALTVGFLRAALKAENLPEDTAIVWYDSSDLSTRPDLSAAAGEAHARRKISDDAYLGYLGLDASDKPDPLEERRRILIDLAIANPAMAGELLDLAGLTVSLPPAPTAPPDAPATPPEVETTPAAADGPPERPAASEDAVLAAADGLVYRALERAGQRLRTAAGKGRPGGVEAVPCDDPTTLHCQVDATKHASLDSLLAGAWDRTVFISLRYGVDRDSLTACLDAYTRGLLASGHAHDIDRLAAALGVTSDRRVHAPV